MGFSETVDGNTISSRERFSSTGVSQLFQFFLWQSHPCFTLNPSGTVAGNAVPSPAHHILGNTLGLGGTGAISQKHPAKNASLSQSEPRKTLGPGRGIRQALRLGYWRGRRRGKAESGTR